jgi:opacity protein-like surface antigen
VSIGLVPEARKVQKQRAAKTNLSGIQHFENELTASRQKEKNKMRIKRALAFRLLICAGLLMCTTVGARAQGGKTDEYPKFEFFFGYSALGDPTNAIGFTNNLTIGGSYATNNNGFEASVTRNFTRYIGLKADFSAHFNNSNGTGFVTFCNPNCTTATQDLRLRTRVYDFLAGPEFKARNSTRFTPFGYVLGGAAHTNAEFSTPGPPTFALLEKGQNGFALALGGGLDIRATKRISVRGSLDYNPVFIQDPATDRRNFARFSLGVLFH